MSGGRANAGFARGYQRRWVDIMAQQTHGIHGALPHQHDEIDNANRAAFEENFRIIKQAWTEDFSSYQGKYWRIPPGETPWQLNATAKWGGGIENGIVRAVSVVPKPVQKPHPPIFQPFASSERSIRWCAREGVTAILPPLHPSLEHQLCEVYADVSRKPLGEGVGVLRDIVIADSDDEARQIWRESGYFCGHEWFEPFGFSKGLDDPKTGEPADLWSNGLAFVGTVDTVTRQVEHLLKRLPIRWIFAWMYNGLMPHDRLMKTIELFWTKVMPRVADVAS
jgi:alkanesulfonate monooxygenase SsuD/methylene tetrahydromethanopterin reductase-like flavin-dependent oxidoreductase (luciferase family)